ncbi:MAG: hypothetical protein P4L84_37440 [Isosphaeraceae bacterium]|nr:hypothetical protein [Isosphaeraceae bacterium]
MRRTFALGIAALSYAMLAAPAAENASPNQGAERKDAPEKKAAQSAPVMIWRGKIHLGDDPGIYGDAQYSGICAELPIRVVRFDPSNTDEAKVSLVLETEGLETFGGYNGHVITVIAYEPDPNQPFHSIERELARAYFTTADKNRKVIDVTPGKGSGPFYLSVRLRSDTTVNPGLYNDFLWKRLSYSSDNVYVKFGFN